ncbi:MAG TPA: class I SAM-dependent methyltransferase [Gaiellaceae bacterium]|jgi:SAM-dependent methyltransferase|nr:class I SAM-dependent methyltransferase [Gaiellaceae bacterium]
MGTAPDGSPIDVYTRLPELGEGEIVASVLPAGASVLELGCGTGRITRQLVGLGFRVTAVDEAAEMLAHVRDAETVQARIEGVELGRRFDGVLLASNLVNAEPLQRRAFLETCRRHADLVVCEGLPLAWSPEDAETALGEVRSRLLVDGVDDGVVRGEVEYEAEGETWRHSFAMRVFADEAELGAALAEARLRLERRLDARWFVAVPT